METFLTSGHATARPLLLDDERARRPTNWEFAVLRSCPRSQSSSSMKPVITLLRSLRQKRRTRVIQAANREAEEVLREPDVKTRFDRIYTQQLWSRATNSRSRSGNGSNDAATADFRRELPAFLASLPAGTLFDAPCGDFYYMRKVPFPQGWRYIGGDIAPSLIADMRRRYLGREFIEHDLRRDAFPDCDVWLCRHCLFHLSLADIMKVLHNFARSRCGIALLTNEKGVESNEDIKSGLYRPLDLTLPPFNLPQPNRELRDFSGRRHPMVVGVWEREQIATAIESFSA